MIGLLRGAEGESREAALEFWNRIPEVRACCDDPETFEKPFAAEAYAFVHLLERYRRMWSVLRYLCSTGALPLAVRGVNVLDVGSGPGPSMLAVQEFYEALHEYASFAGVRELLVPSPRLNFVERSQTMRNFYSRFREFTGRYDAVGPGFSNFTGLDLKSIRAFHKRQNEVESWWDPETGEDEEIYDPVGAAESASRLHRYRLVVLSNFLTLPTDVERWREELCALFKDLRPGAVVVVLGGSGGKYTGIYQSATQIAKESRLREEDWASYESASKPPSDDVALLIKGSQHRVYLALEELAGADSLSRDKAWPDYWNPVPSPDARYRFSLRIYRRDRWPKGRRKRSV